MLEELLLETQEGLADIDFSTLLDFPAKHPVPEGEKYLVFHLDEEIYGIDSKKVEEVSLSLPVTPLPNAHVFVDERAADVDVLTREVDLAVLADPDGIVVFRVVEVGKRRGIGMW